MTREELLGFCKNHNVHGCETVEEQRERLAREGKLDINELADKNEVASQSSTKQKIKAWLQPTIFWKLIAPIRLTRKFFIYLRVHGAKVAFGKVAEKLHLSAKSKKKFNVQYINKILPDEAERKAQSETVFPRNIKFSILVPLYNTPMNFLEEMIKSVTDQTYANWELCLADGSDDEHPEVGEYCKRLSAEDSRIVYKKLEENKGISENTNECLRMATGDYIGLFDHDDLLHPSVLFEDMKAICEYDADFIYTDELTFLDGDLTNVVTYHFKSDFAIDTLRANNYICHFSCFDRKLVNQAGMFRDEYNGSQDHDIILRLTAVAKHIYHIPKILYFWRSHANSTSQDINSKTYAITAGQRAVKESLAQLGIEAEVGSSPAFPTIYDIKYKINGNPKISIVIANKDHLQDLVLCIDSIQRRSTYDNYEIIIVENNSTSKEIFEFYDLIQTCDNVKVVTWDKPFNYSAINNFGVENATGDYICLLNNDTEVLSPDWMQDMLMYAQRSDVGAVGAKLLFLDQTVQHAGVIIGAGEDGVAIHSHVGWSNAQVGYMGRLYFAQNVSAVTGACLMVSKEKFLEVGGLEEKLTVAYNDVDFCLKLLQKGYLNVMNPDAYLFHFESKSRGYEDNPEKRARFKSEVGFMKDKWKDVLEAGDPYYNPNLSTAVPWGFGVGIKMRYE